MSDKCCCIDANRVHVDVGEDCETRRSSDKGLIQLRQAWLTTFGTNARLGEQLRLESALSVSTGSTAYLTRMSNGEGNDEGNSCVDVLAMLAEQAVGLSFG